MIITVSIIDVFSLGKQCFKVKEREMNKGRATMYFQTTVIFNFLYITLVLIFKCIFCCHIRTYAFYFCLWPNLCATLYFPMNSLEVFCVSLSVLVSLSFWLPLLVFVQSFTFNEKSDHDKMNLVLRVIIIITIVKLLHIIFVFCLSLYL